MLPENAVWLTAVGCRVVELSYIPAPKSAAFAEKTLWVTLVEPRLAMPPAGGAPGRARVGDAAAEGALVPREGAGPDGQRAPVDDPPAAGLAGEVVRDG